MRNGYHGFTPQDLRNIDEVVAALRELVSAEVAFTLLVKHRLKG